MRLAAISVDLDEIGCYAAIHGLAVPRGREHPIYERALPRLARFFDDLGVRATFFAVGQDAEDDAKGRALRALVERDHEIASHSQRHLYDLTRRDRATMRREVEESLDAIERAVGQRPRGFRAPGYTITNELFALLRELGLAYDSSVFPCPPYYAPKALTIALLRLRAALGRGRESRSLVDDPRVLLAPADPYFPADRAGAYFRRGPRGGLVEVPIGVTRGAHLPFIGTSVVLAGRRGARLLARQMVGRPVVVLELHGIDLADASADGLEWLAPRQPDLARTLEAKRAALEAAIEVLAANGYRFVTTLEAALSVADQGPAT